ncbi:MAG: protein kinase [Acidobacteria bacterium]|nr:protein kinase [Acidobacteriota bacterium]
MTLTSGSKLGAFEILSPIGKGGMGEVYRARDTNLGRDVAVKILPEAFAHDADRLARFQREAQVLASLNHPNIAHIYGLEAAGESRCIVMELVEGETLDGRLKRGPIPVDEALAMAKQIAEALEAAHEKSIIHRDLKPANVKITPEGRVKVLDFGLARAAGGDAASGTLSQSPTLVSGTLDGMILGTAAYMSPEQAKGRPVDARSDIWAFGCVLYEMLTGRQPFTGDSIVEILGGITKVDPDWTALPQGTPPLIRSLLRRCLNKDRTRRLQYIADARVEIGEALNEPAIAAGIVTPVRKRREALAWGVAALAVMLAVILTAILLRFRTVVEQPEIRLEINPPPNARPDFLAISPDGQKIVFAATVEGRPRLWVRSLDSVSARALAGTEDGQFPFWSPDSRSIGFFSEAKLKRINIDSGLVQTLANAPLARGGTWNGDGIILFGPALGGIFRVPATGGETIAVTRVDSPEYGKNHFFPQFLPDGHHFLYYVPAPPEARGVYVSQLEGSEPRRLLDADAAAVYSSSGHLLFVRQGALFAQAFDPFRLALNGNPSPMADQVFVNASTSLAGLSASAAGPIVYRIPSGAGPRQFLWFDRSGKEVEKAGNPLGSQASFSSDGRRVAVIRTVGGNGDVWLLETTRGVLRRFTVHAASESLPLWSPDGNTIVFGSNRTGVADLYQKPASGAGSEQLLLTTAQGKGATDWSIDGRYLLYRSVDPETGYDIWALPFHGDRKPFPVVRTEFEERDAQFSPDGKWIAYQSNESGRFEIYIQPFPVPGGKEQISTDGGAQVRWRRDGKELFYVALDGRLMAVSIRTASNGKTLEAGTPVPLFNTRIGGAVQGNDRQQYMVSPDGRRFLMSTLTEEATSSPITIILNWKPK